MNIFGGKGKKRQRRVLCHISKTLARIIPFLWKFVNIHENSSILCCYSQRVYNSTRPKEGPHSLPKIFCPTLSIHDKAFAHAPLTLASVRHASASLISQSSFILHWWPFLGGWKKESFLKVGSLICHTEIVNIGNKKIPRLKTGHIDSIQGIKIIVKTYFLSFPFKKVRTKMRSLKSQ